MKTKYMKSWKTLCVALMACTAWGLSSCDEDVNDWGVDASHDRLFAPLVYETMQVAPTSVQMHYSQVITATRYVFEFYKDSLQYLPENLYRTDTIYADTLTVYKDDSSPAKVEYATLFEELAGSTQYSVRMKGLDKDGKASGYLGVAFQTPSEQLFQSATATTESVTLTWTPTERITHLIFFDYDGEKYVPREEPIELTAEDIAAASKTLDGLTSGTNYKVQICNNDEIRGEYTFKTLGLGEGITIRVPWVSETEVIDMDALMEEYEVEGTSNLTLEFEPGKTYNINTWELPSVDNLLFTSTTADQNNRPVINLPQIKLSSSMLSLAFQYVTIDGKDDGAAYFFQPGSLNIGSVTFEGCYIRNIKRSLIRTSGGLNTTNITVNNSVLEHIGWNGYGLINISGTNTIERIEVTNSTLINMGEQLMDIDGGIGDVVFTNNTLYMPAKMEKPMNQLFRFDNYNKTPASPARVTMSGCIFAGLNGDKSLNAGSKKYSFFDYSDNCYLTSDVPVGGVRFEGINELELTSDDLFVDPQGGDFHFNPAADIPAGVKSAGDPRWH